MAMSAHAVKGHEGQDTYEMEESEQQKMLESLEAFAAKMEEEAKRRVDRRLHVEERWLDDLRQYNGQYDEKLLERLKKDRSSKVFVNLTRPKTNSMIARLVDLLFPTDDRNWSVSPTPVPELTEQAEAALEKVYEADKKAMTAQAEMEQADAQGDQEGRMQAAQAADTAEEEKNAAQQAADQLQEVMQEAKRRARLMQEEIDDQFKTCLYQSEARDAIEDACKIGMGVIKGPVLGERMKTRFQKVGGEVYELTREPNDMPAAHRVDPWSFFPDPDARRVEDSEGFFERHLMTKTQLRKLAQRPDIDDDTVRTLLTDGPDRGGSPSYLIELVNLTGQQTDAAKEYFHVWEYTGPVDHDDMMLLSQAFEDDSTAAEVEDADPLVEFHAKIWFAQGKVLSFALHPLDSNEPIYSVFNLERDEGSLFGYGIPWLMRNEQSIVNASHRAMMDNAGLTVGPQIVYDPDQVEPDNGISTLEPRKMWKRKSGGQANPSVPAFETYNIPTQQDQLAAIIEMARQSIDEVTSMPQIAQGEQGTGVTKTAQGMAMLMNSANVVFRRVVKNFDDDMTTPLIRRFYHWNMQFSDKDEIKGDYDVVARGSSVLLVREMQAQNLVMIAQMFGDHPVYGPMLKHGDLLREVFRAHMVPTDEIVKTDREFEKFQSEQAKEKTPEQQQAEREAKNKSRELDLKEREMDKDIEISNMEWDARRYIADRQFDAKMHELAERLNMNREQLETKWAESESKANDKAEAARITAEQRDRSLAVETAMKQRTGDSSGGAI